MIPASHVLAAFSDAGEEMGSYAYVACALLFVGLVALPLGFWYLWRQMLRAGIQRPPVIAYFCAFGTLGGYLLIAAGSPSALSLLIIPFAPLSALSLLGSLIYLQTCRPFTRFHMGAAVACAVLLAPVGLVAMAVLMHR